MSLDHRRIMQMAQQAERLMLSLTVLGDDDTSTAASYHLAAGGSRVRCRLALEAGLRLRLPIDTVTAIASACELLHNASLIHDDLQDGDKTRRGSESVWARFGSDIALCTGDLFVSAAYAALARSDDQSLPRLMRATHLAVTQAIHGQILDRHGYDALNLNLRNYLSVVTRKSGALLRLPLELCLMASGHDKAVHLADETVNEFAIAYQISDDLEDWQDDETSDRPNIMRVLRIGVVGAGDVPNVMAIDMAVAHCNKAIELAQRLPAGSGSVLAEHAVRMRTTLLMRSAA